MEKDELNQALLDNYFSGVHDTLDSLIEAAKGAIKKSEEIGLDDPKIGYKDLLESFKQLKDVANERQNNRR